MLNKYIAIPIAFLKHSNLANNNFKWNRKLTNVINWILGTVIIQYCVLRQRFTLNIFN